MKFNQHDKIMNLTKIEKNVIVFYQTWYCDDTSTSVTLVYESQAITVYSNCGIFEYTSYTYSGICHYLIVEVFVWQKSFFLKILNWLKWALGQLCQMSSRNRH